MNNIVTEIGNRFDALNNRMEEAEEWITDIEDKIIENKKADQKRESIMEHKNSLRNSVTLSSIIIKHLYYRNLRRKERGWWSRTLFEELIVENFPSLGKEKDIQILEAQSSHQNQQKQGKTKTHCNQISKI